MEHGKNPLAVRRWSRPWDANVARTSGTRRSLDFWAITSRYRLKERSPLMVTIMAMARGLSSEVKGTPRFHSKTAAASDGTIADSCEWICPALRVYRGGPHMRSLISIDFPAPKMEPESACGINCLRSLAPMWRLRCSTTQATYNRTKAFPLD